MADQQQSFLAQFDAAPAAQKPAILFQWVATQPLALFAELRRDRPILFVPGNIVLLTRFADVTEALSRNQVFTVRPYAPKMDPSVGPFMLARDGTVYNQRDKGIMRALMQQADLPAVRRMVADLAAKAIAGGTRGGALDLVPSLTRLVPVRLTGAYFGFPGPDEATMMAWSYATQNDMFHNLQNVPAIHDANVKAGQGMQAYLTGFLPKRKAQVDADPAIDDIVARLLRLQTPESIGFDLARVMSNVMGLLVGGVETTSAAIVQAVDQILDRPNVLAQAVAAAGQGDTAEFDAIFWEALRFNPMNPFVGRLSVEPYVIAAGTEREATIPGGSFVLCSNASAMHDGSVVPSPEIFNAGRPAYHYMHFGYGDHVCLGDQVSLQQAPEIARQLFLAGFTKRADGAAGHLDFKGGPFPESFTLVKAS